MRIKNIFYQIPSVKNWLTACKTKREQREIMEWEKQGKPFPPPHIVKQLSLIKCAKDYNLKVFVESGTYYGDMVETMKDMFDKIYSIELSQPLFEKAKKRFKSAKNVELIHGDSGKELKKIIEQLNEPALFWLDGHYSGGETALGEEVTPIYEELNALLDAKEFNHVIIIDDARLFGTDSGYPDMEALKNFIRSKRNTVDIAVVDDSIRIIPKH